MVTKIILEEVSHCSLVSAFNEEKREKKRGKLTVRRKQQPSSSSIQLSDYSPSHSGNTESASSPI